DGTSLATGSADETVRVWDAKTGAERLSLKGHTRGVNTVAWHPKGSHLVSGSNGDSVKPGEAIVWDAKTGVASRVVKGLNNGARAVAWSPDGKSFAAVDGDGEGGGWVTVWDAETGAERFSAVGHVRTVYAVSWSPDGARLLTSSQDYTARVWDARNGSELL